MLCLPLTVLSLSLSTVLPLPFIPLASPLPRLLADFPLNAVVGLFIYGRALSACVGLSNIHLSCAAIIQYTVILYMRNGKRALEPAVDASVNAPNINEQAVWTVKPH